MASLLLPPPACGGKFYLDVDAPVFSLLLVDDEPLVLEMLGELFSEAGYELCRAPNGEEALSLVEGRRIDAALLDLRLPGMGGMALLKELKARFPDAQLCIMTGQGGVQEAVEAMKNGACDFLQKPLAPLALKARLRQLHEIWRLQQENERLRGGQQYRFGYEPLVGNSQVMRTLKALIARVAPTDSSVLISGETGSGKELVARALHQSSGRAGGPFVTVDCASLSESLLESEIFGHVKGAFTGAHAAHPGLVRTAEGGTIFFDEIGELPLAAQSKLLRLLQEREVRPVGSAASRQVNVRVLAATNRDLAEEVRERRFRSDLFFRLNVLEVHVPALRERREDIQLLAGHFLHTLKTRVSTVQAVSGDALACLEGYSWPGNVRELENAIRRAMVLCHGAFLRPEDLPAEVCGEASSGPPLDGSLASYEAAAVRSALVRSGGQRRQAARILGIGESTLYRKLKEYDLEG